MKASMIEIIIIAFLLSCLTQSCSNETSMSYEMGKEFRKANIEFKRGFNK